MKIRPAFLWLLIERNIGITILAKTLEIDPYFFILVISAYGCFNYEETKALIKFFGAEYMARAIDWEGMHVSCPIL